MAALQRIPIIGVVAAPQSYVNILYLLLAFPLGTAYFVLLVTGISVGAGMVIMWVGVPILVLVFAASWALCEFERILAVFALHEDIPRTRFTSASVHADDALSTAERLFVGTWRRFKAHLTNRLTWTGMLYLFLRFPLGVATFTVAVVLISVSMSLAVAPAYM
ncbi:MAG TPA: hypothetical protein DCP37_10990 [Dehalococcoidia bacterium]|jgi:hypothetical protein|nr:hypothetical protein [Dehalococcoidia bacterium]|tara:strand:- start:446 stop:934 length:489 start_codon:yes stop_codon:yes gene_type:complete